ncbi:hypothetical protein [Marinobacter gelidimuriae]|uniref:hypothetical protein n=1 Tax=Marinobacter gelidimuriae TaxID=2739064 RepID=UPI00037DA173|nr:hypothetical protein [Marinobacter gelidimuriae]
MYKYSLAKKQFEILGEANKKGSAPSRKALKHKARPTGLEPVAIAFGRRKFAWACAMPWFQKLKKYQLLYPGLDVRAFANWYEKTAAYGIIYGTLVTFMSAPFFYLFKPLTSIKIGAAAVWQRLDARMSGGCFRMRLCR